MVNISEDEKKAGINNLGLLWLIVIFFADFFHLHEIFECIVLV